MTRALVIFTDDFKPRPYWWEAAAPGVAGTDAVPEDADVAIVGSGYAGLCAALELARSGTRVRVLEAEALGFGASTRNGGMVSGGINVGKGVDLVARWGEDTARALLEDGLASYDFLGEIIAREKIDCDYRRVGRFVGAHSPGAYAALARRAEQLGRVLDLGLEMVPRARQHEEIASEYYYGGLRVARAGGLHPARYHRGLLDACRRHGVGLHAHAPVRRIESRGDGVSLVTPKGVVAAREAVIATNGYTGEATPWHRRRLVPAASYIVATEPIGEARVRGLFPGLRMIADTKRVLYYFRPSPDGTRVLFGGRPRLAHAGPVRGARDVHGYLCRVFPQLRGVRITHAWRGNVAMTFDALPHMGYRDRVHYCLGCNGSGVAMMGYLGHQTALKILGRSNRPCAFDAMPFGTRPLYTGNTWFLPFVSAYYHVRDELDRSLARWSAGA
ncbi:MAG: FAD-binding oxidoreductase [Gammaproteobacteria bacterium]|nr:FAD-binding oxidoreductase [Gammaproteobacteria bacterium]NIR84530.1 FAD-binding oxidoreductase [Gammaproteobacteria bacterium]NIR90433.1 FAD-binding oxidoreductase [Gammaproteobacteria bacterium]NIU05581.1 FAD-binding oxidoreductase [Gammaproteobacteria bacterium]NIV52720.1 FAD-dependent oxidoreductase [Gammaproteobacteria bacterium]